jgi:hypothetical protein
MTLTHVSFNYQCDRETRELGEAFPEIAAAEELYTKLRAALERVQRTGSQEADNRATEFLELLANARHDSSWPLIVLASEDAFEEAMVRPVEIKPKRAA